MRRSADTPLRAHNNQSAFRAIGGRTSCNLNHFGRWQTLRSDGSCPLSGVKRTLRRPLAGSISDLTARPDVSFNKLTSCWGGDFVASLWTAPISARADQAVALRRRWVHYPMGAVLHSFQYPRSGERARD